MTPMRAPTGMALAPSLVKILNIMPSSWASTSIVALSVSISSRTSPATNLSPSLTRQAAMLPSVMVGERAGMVKF